MNVGEKVDVTISGAVVAQAEVKEVGDGTATLIVPATRVVMAVKTQLAPEVGPSNESGTQTIVDEVVRATNEPVAPVENASASEPVPQSSVADKVITSSSVPTPDASSDKSKFDALDPAVQAQIMEIVNAHNAAQEAANDSAQE